MAGNNFGLELTCGRIFKVFCPPLGKFGHLGEIVLPGLKSGAQRYHIDDSKRVRSNMQPDRDILETGDAR